MKQALAEWGDESRWRALADEALRDGTPGYDAWATAKPDDVFRPDVAAKACAWIEANCRHVKGAAANKPFALSPWQRAAVGLLFGWATPHPEAGMVRRYREAFWFIPRKNGKTTLLAAILLLVMRCDREEGAEIYSAAADREQASLVYQQVAGMVRKNPALERVMQIRESNRVVRLTTPSGKATNSFYKALSAEAGTKHGANSHFVVIDELHAQPNRELVDVLMTSTGSRTQPLVLHITTSDYERPSICNEKHSYATRVREGAVDDHAFFPLLFEAQPEDDWKHPDTWRKANPNLGVSVSLDYLERECRRAAETPAYENTFKRLHLNMRTEQDVRWLPVEKWDACSEEPELVGPCYGGMDLSSTGDFTAIALYFPETRSVICKQFIPETAARERLRRSRLPLDEWRQRGVLQYTPGDVVDQDIVKAEMARWCETYDVRDIGFDRYNADKLVAEMMAEGFAMVGFGMGYASMSAPMKHLESLVLSRKLRHGGDPLLRWNIANVVVEVSPAGDMKPHKGKAAEKIDGVVAAIIAIGRANACAAGGRSIYDDQGILAFNV